MVIKKFLGKTEEEAVAAAKKELGEGIVIMNVRQVKPKGFLAAFKGKQTEVTVALEEERESARPVRREPERSAAGPSASASDAAGSGPILRSVEVSDPNSIEKKLDSLQTLLESRLKQSVEETGREPSAGDGAEEAGESERSAAKEEDREEIGEQEKFVRLLYNTMIENEVAEKYANQILEDVDPGRKPNMPFDHILANIYQKIILKFGKSEGIVPAEKGPRVVFFIGPTGVGKTTTIAKLASALAVEEKKKTVLLTADTYRIAAAEQLRTYAQIMEVPFRVIYSPEEFQGALRDFQEYDYIFVDTAGHSHQNAEQLDKMKEYLEPMGGDAQIQVFLVLSATTKYKDLLKIADNYKEITDYQLIFTKLDETTTLGNLLNLKLYADTPIAYITCGQNVPNDIERFNPQKTVKQLLGGKA
ncbi:MAG: flagellar biosynthesis protein FlhF [Clostridium sp.]|nr:flagellar biosynthesis protein FlhF [Acetatifactor muris]MCM1525997.1 flagellar biosynthesis protein FlhF [Bacteroides sp.]MCM1562243.1 flagellar biosynthesis protein FlhF [Clostridium sp.]